MIIKDDFKISGDTVVWLIFCILIIGIFASYNLGYKNGIRDEKIGTLEELNPLTKGIADATN